MSNGPLPTRLVSLNELPALDHGEKHAYPSGQPTVTTAAVDVNLLLSTLKHTDTQVGEWLNVIGYVQAEDGTGKRDRRDMGGQVGFRGNVAKVQAVMLWSAGGVRIGEYEKALEMRKGAGIQ
ncbi:MAG: hypothetical protein Q9218_001622 [Villophora microphyllina]